jgi:stage V sporulation protein B
MKEMSGDKGIIYNTAYLTISAILVKLIGVLYKVPLSYILTDQGMGYFNAAYTVYSILYLLGTAGVPKAITVLVSGYKAEGNVALESRIFVLLSRVFFVFGLILCGVLLGVAAPLSEFLGTPHASITICAIAPSLIFVSLSGVFRGYLSANHEFSSCAVSSVIEATSRLLLGVAGVWIGKELQLPLYMMSALAVLGIGVGSLLSTIYLYINSKKCISNKKTEQNGCCLNDKRIIKSFLRIAVPITLGAMASGFSSVIDLSMIIRSLEAGGMSEGEATAVYGNYTTLAVPMLQMAISLITPLAVVILPTLASEFRAQSHESFSRTLAFGSELCAMISFPIASVFLFFPYPLLALFFHDASAALAAPMLRNLFPAVLMFSFLLIANTALESIGQAKMQMISMLIGVAVKIIANVALLQSAAMGILGAPIATVLSYAASLIFSIFALSIHRVPIVPIVKKQMLAALCSFASAGLGFLLYKSTFIYFSNASVRTCAAFFAFGILYFLFLFVTGGLNVEKIMNLSKQPKKTN